MNNTKKSGICYLVGAGPGDPGLLTMRGKECIERADVLIYDYLCNPELLRFAKPDAERIYAGKKSADHTMTQEQINQLLVEKTKEHKVVTRLKGGDPFIFGRGGEEAQALAKAKQKFEIVPGISSAIAGAAYAGIPVTHRAHNTMLTIFTGHEDPEKTESTMDFENIARTPGTKVMLMGVERIAKITDALQKHGADSQMPVALIRWATTGKQETLTGTLADIAEKVESAKFKAPAVAVFGEVVSLRKELNWFEKRPLFGKRIAVTRTRKQAGTLIEQLRELGADAFELPTIRIEPPKDVREFAELVQDAHLYDWIVFTSPNAVDAFFEMFYKLYDDARSLGGARIAAIGPATALRVKDQKLHVDLQPDKYIAEAVIEAFKKYESVENLKFLLPRAEETREVLGKELAKMGAIVDEIAAYRTVPETGDPTGGVARFREEGADMITFTSSSTVKNFLDLKLELPKNLKTASIGPITSETMRDHKLAIDCEAKQHDIPGLVKTILQYFTKSKSDL
ncbi:MAG: uroporphyrinogen-III C-methyltransferase [Chthoniobacterales bacterium]